MINEFTFSPKLVFNLEQRREYALEVLPTTESSLKEVSFEGNKIQMDSSKIIEINGLYRTRSPNLIYHMPN